MAAEEQGERHQRQRAPQTPTRCPHFRDESEDGHRQQQGGDDGVGEQSDRAFRPTDFHLDDPGTGQIIDRQQFGQRLHHLVGDAILQGLVRGQRRRSTRFVAEFGNDDALVDHGLGDLGIASGALRSSPHLGTHDGDIFVARFVPPTGNRRTRPDGTPFDHDDAVAGHRDQCPRGDRSLVDVGDGQHVGIDDDVTDYGRCIDTTTECVDIEDHGVRFGCYRILHDTFHISRQTGVDHAALGVHRVQLQQVDKRSRFLFGALLRRCVGLFLRRHVDRRQNKGQSETERGLLS